VDISALLASFDPHSIEEDGIAEVLIRRVERREPTYFFILNGNDLQRDTRIVDAMADAGIVDYQLVPDTAREFLPADAVPFQA